MKRITKRVLLLIVAAAVAAGGCLGYLLWRGEHADTHSVIIDIGVSERFTQKERRAAAKVALGELKGYRGCTIQAIYYDEAYSIRQAASYIDQPQYSIYGLDPENIIVLRSDFHVSAEAGDTGFEPNTDAIGWDWYLIRDGKDQPWKEYSHGWG
ncbi:MAG: hypothetical protein LBG83_02610 [Oscillospiraceae bacterium]|nr:hypothetical protein [Oscillospiraceae bacterium]